MYKIKFTTQYKQSYKLMVKRGRNIKLLDDIVNLLANGGMLDKRFKDHGLLGNFQGLRECHIQPDWILIYLIEKEFLTLTLINTGTHSDLF